MTHIDTLPDTYGALLAAYRIHTAGCKKLHLLLEKSKGMAPESFDKELLEKDIELAELFVSDALTVLRMLETIDATTTSRFRKFVQEVESMGTTPSALLDTREKIAAHQTGVRAEREAAWGDCPVCPYATGTVEADAWHQGRRFWRNATRIACNESR